MGRGRRQRLHGAGRRGYECRRRGSRGDVRDQGRRRNRRNFLHGVCRCQCRDENRRRRWTRRSSQRDPEDGEDGRSERHDSDDKPSPRTRTKDFAIVELERGCGEGRGRGERCDPLDRLVRYHGARRGRSKRRGNRRSGSVRVRAGAGTELLEITGREFPPDGKRCIVKLPNGDERRRKRLGRLRFECDLRRSAYPRVERRHT